MLLSNSMSHRLDTSAALDLAERERLGNRKILTVSPTPYGYSVWNDSLISIPTTV